MNILNMKKLIEALQIFLKYKDINYPTICVHDTLIVVGFEENEITKEDKEKLDELGFFWSEEFENWASFRYGSA